VNVELRDEITPLDEDVWLIIPPFSDYLRTVRLVAADAAVRAGLDCFEVEDFRIAVDELCHLLMSSTDHAISMTFRVVGRSVVARGVAPFAPLDDLSQRIVSSVSDYYETNEHATEVGFAVMKRRRAVAAL
jgi:hypothetical protein